MYFSDNYVTLSDVVTDIIPTKLTNDLDLAIIKSEYFKVENWNPTNSLIKIIQL